MIIHTRIHCKYHPVSFRIVDKSIYVIIIGILTVQVLNQQSFISLLCSINFCSKFMQRYLMTFCSIKQLILTLDNISVLSTIARGVGYPIMA